ncbi:MAG: hypothetical protein ACSW78_02810, partial [Lachnospiraceae bacterium]
GTLPVFLPDIQYISYHMIIFRQNSSEIFESDMQRTQNSRNTDHLLFIPAFFPSKSLKIYVDKYPPIL